MPGRGRGWITKEPFPLNVRVRARRALIKQPSDFFSTLLGVCFFFFFKLPFIPIKVHNQITDEMNGWSNHSLDFSAVGKAGQTYCICRRTTGGSVVIDGNCIQGRWGCRRQFVSMSIYRKQITSTRELKRRKLLLWR